MKEKKLERKKPEKSIMTRPKSCTPDQKGHEICTETCKIDNPEFKTGLSYDPTLPSHAGCTKTNCSLNLPHQCSLNCAMENSEKLLSHDKNKLSMTEQVMAPHECSDCCPPNCTFKGTMLLQTLHEYSVVVTNFPVSRDHTTSTLDMLNDFFSSQCGRIIAIRTTERSSDPDVLEALITFHDTKSAEKALSFNNVALHERIIQVHSALNVDISHLEKIPPVSLTERIQENVESIKEGLSHISEQLPEVKEAVLTKAAAVTEGIGNMLSSAYETVAAYIHPEGHEAKLHEEKQKGHAVEPAVAGQLSS